MSNSLFPSIIPTDDSYDAMELVKETDAWVLQGIAAAHPKEAINGQSAAVEISGWICGNHTANEIDEMVAIIKESEPPRSEIDLSPALNEDGNLSMY